MSDLSSPQRAISGVLLGALSLLCAHAMLPTVAAAYCRTSSCSDCPRDPDTGCVVGGVPIAWPGACVSYSLNRLASSAVDLETASALVSQAFAVWQDARCDDQGGRPSIEVFDGFGPVACDRVEFSRTGTNANLIVFRDVGWPYGMSGTGLALTTVTSNGKTAEIYDADMEINATLPLTLGGNVQKGLQVGAHDLLSILVHEAGHFLGLDHSREPDSVMQLELPPGAVRTALSADDVAAICAAYPPDRKVSKCDETPRGGLSKVCPLGPVTGGCSIGVRQSGFLEDASVMLMLLGGASLWRRGLRERSTRARPSPRQGG